MGCGPSFYIKQEMAPQYILIWEEAEDFKLIIEIKRIDEKLYSLQWDLNSQPLGYESNALPTEL